jgi:hypothetical protein
MAGAAVVTGKCKKTTELPKQTAGILILSVKPAPAICVSPKESFGPG